MTDRIVIVSCRKKKKEKKRLHGPRCNPACLPTSCATLVQRVSSSEAIRGVLRAMANALTNALVSSDQRPPTSRATTTSCARRRGPKELWVCAFFPPPCCSESHTIVRVGSSSWRAIAVQRTHHGGVDRHLGPPRTGNPSTTTSSLRASKAFGAGTSNWCAHVRQLPCKSVP